MMVLDVGANVGLYTALAMHHCPYGRVFAIEPHAESQSFLRKTIMANSNPTNARAEVFDCAASDHEGRATLFLNPDNKDDNRLARDTCKLFEIGTGPRVWPSYGLPCSALA
jgi:FkbM family methyltransferase